MRSHSEHSFDALCEAEPYLAVLAGRVSDTYGTGITATSYCATATVGEALSDAAQHVGPNRVERGSGVDSWLGSSEAWETLTVHLTQLAGHCRHSGECAEEMPVYHAGELPEELLGATRCGVVAELVYAAGLTWSWYLVGVRVGEVDGYSLVSREGHLLNYQQVGPADHTLDSITIGCDARTLARTSCEWLGRGVAPLSWGRSFHDVATEDGIGSLVELVGVLREQLDDTELGSIEIIGLWPLPDVAYEMFCVRHDPDAL